MRRGGAQLAVTGGAQGEREILVGLVNGIVGDGHGEALGGVACRKAQGSGFRGVVITGLGAAVGGGVADLCGHQRGSGFRDRQRHRAVALGHRAGSGGEGDDRQVIGIGDGAGGRARGGADRIMVGGGERDGEVVVALIGGVLHRRHRDGAGALASGDGQRGAGRGVVGWRVCHLVSGIGAFAASVRGLVADGYAASWRRVRQSHRELDAAAFGRRGGGNGDQSVVVVGDGHRMRRGGAQPGMRRRAEGDGEILIGLVCAVIGDGDGEALGGVAGRKAQLAGGRHRSVVAAGRGAAVGAGVADLGGHQRGSGLRDRQRHRAGALGHRAGSGREGDHRQVIGIGDGADGRTGGRADRQAAGRG